MRTVVRAWELPVKLTLPDAPVAPGLRVHPCEASWRLLIRGLPLEGLQVCMSLGQHPWEPASRWCRSTFDGEFLAVLRVASSHTMQPGAHRPVNSAAPRAFGITAAFGLRHISCRATVACFVADLFFV